MRKLLFFVLLFGAGLAVLAWLEEGTDPELEASTREDRDPIRPPAEGGAGLGLRGQTSAILYDAETKRAVLRLDSRDSGTEEGVDRFVDVHVEVYDEEGEEGEAAQAEIEAQEARILRLAGEDDFQPEYENRARLLGVEAVFHSGVPIAPLTVITPETTVDAIDPTRRKLLSDAPLEIHSSSLEGGGRGYVIDIDESVVEIRQGGWLELRESEQGTVRISAEERGSLTISRDEDGDVLIRVEEGSSILVTGERRSRLTAESLRLRGVEAAEGDTLTIRSLEAEGGVVWTEGESEFRCGLLTMDFDENGEPESARLEHLPRARFVLSLDPDAIQGLPADELRVFAIDGQKRMELVSEDDGSTGFQVDGPATVEARGIRLRSNGDVNGRLTEDATRASFRATGGVVVEGELASLETAEFELTSSTDPDGQEVLSGVASGGARLVGALEDGRAFTVTSPDRMVVERKGEDTRIVDGRDVEISVDGEDGFRARADRVTDFRVRDLTFAAEGNVSFEGSEGKGRGEYLAVRGPGHFALTGTPQQKASFQGPHGRAEAGVVERDGDRIHARGAVVADLESLPADRSTRLEGLAVDRYHLEGDDLVLVRRERTPDAGPTELFLMLEVQGSVRTRIDMADQIVDLTRCRHLTVERVERYDGEIERERWMDSTSIIRAEGGVEVDLDLPESSIQLSSDELDVDRFSEKGAETTQTIVARGNVAFQGRTEIKFRGRGELLTFDPDGIGHLEAPVSGQVELFGLLPSQAAPFRLTAERIDFSEAQIDAEHPEIFFRSYRVRAKRMTATRDQVEFFDSVRTTGRTPKGDEWVLRAGQVRLEGRAEAEVETAELANIRAEDGVEFALGDLFFAHGDTLTGGRASGIMRLSGSPARIESPFADYEAEWIEFDPVLRIVVATGRGRILPRPIQDGGGSSAALPPQEPQEEKDWKLEFLSSSTLVEPDSLVYVLQEPFYSQTGPTGEASSLRASWSVMWIDRARWEQLPDGLELEEKEEEAAGFEDVGGPMFLFFSFIDRYAVAELVREAYFEGPVEVLSGENAVATADAVYLDLVSGHGWLANAKFDILGKVVGQDFKKISIKADWLRHSSDGSLVADDATVTPCEFEEPHVQVVTGDLVLKPASGDTEEHFSVELSDNRIELYDRLNVPLPSVGFGTDENLKPILPTISVGDTARFGSLLGIEFSGSAKKATEPISDVLTGGEEDREYDADYAVDAKYLGSRGGLLDLGLEVASDDYYVEAIAGLVYDTGSDSGFIQVDEDDRSDFRRWLRSTGDFRMGHSAFDFVYTDQSDLGVQSEFYEKEFLRYELSETYALWKRAKENSFVEATTKVRVDGFRTDVEELPTALAYRGGEPLFHVGSYPVVYTGEVEASYLRRREGNDTYTKGGQQEPLSSPFGLPSQFEDGLGNRETGRLDTVQGLELPVPLGDTGLKLTPFSSAQFTGWTEAEDDDENATRFSADVGARLSTTLWKRSKSGLMHQIAPYVSYSNEVSSEEDETPVVYSEVEREVFGDFVELGLRSRLGMREGRSLVDLDLRGIYASDRSDDEDDGWLPLEVFGRLKLDRARGRVTEIWHDGRYDVEEGETVYSLAAIGTRLEDDFGFQFTHQYGRDDDLQKQVDAVSVAGFYRWTPKWEFEGKQTFSLLEDKGLGFDVIVRRYGHDVIFEFETQVREGEGTSVGFKVVPRLGYNPSRIGFLNW